MQVLNVHERVLAAPAARVGEMLDTLSSRDDAIWPVSHWPPMRFDRPLEVGARGGHGPIRYTVEAYEPGTSVLFRFTAPRGFCGTHGFEIEPVDDARTRLRHVLKMDAAGPARLTWPLVFRPLHDALLEDALSRAAAGAGAEPEPEPVPWSRWVRLLRRLLGGRRTASRQGLRVLVCFALPVWLLLAVAGCGEDPMFAPQDGDFVLPLARIEVGYGFGMRAVGLESVKLRISYSEYGSAGTLLDMDLVGIESGYVRSFDLDEIVDPVGFADMITNGTDDELSQAILVRSTDGRGSVGGPWLESDRLECRRNGPLVPDLGDTTISRIVVDFERCRISVPGMDPGGDGAWVDVSVRGEIRIY